MSTIDEIIAKGRQQLRDAGLPHREAALDARLLAQHALGLDSASLLASGQEPAAPTFMAGFGELLTRRAAREPIAYILGRRDFWHLTLAVTPAVLIPRPETELLVEAALEHAAGIDATVADVCTGSGCVAVAMAVARPGLRVVATDISESALAVAAGNARRYQVENRIRLVRTSILDGVSARFDLIVANPPYVPAADWASLQPEVRQFEPVVALLGGDTGLDIVRALAEGASARLKPGGLLLFEFGAGQEEAVRHLIAEATPLKIIDVRQDLQGIPRMVIAQLPTIGPRSDDGGLAHPSNRGS
jgi:release factor glutamine methyltransferase